MVELSGAARLRATLSAFDDRQRKIVAGMITVMIRSPERVREREWVVEQFTHLCLLAGDFEEIGGTHEGVDVVQAYVRANIDALMNASFELFQRVAADMAELEADQRGLEPAVARALTYF